MANTTASTLITTVLDNMSRASTGTTRSGIALSTAALSWLNDTMMSMARVHDFKELYTTSSGTVGTSVTVASTKTYTFPTNWKMVYDVRIIDGTNSRKLECITFRKYDKWEPYPESGTTSTPCRYIPFGNSFDLDPIPDAVYTMPIKYVAWPTILTSTSSAISYEPIRDDIVTAGMTAQGFKYLQMYTDAAVWDKEFKALLREAILHDDYPVDRSPQGMGFDTSYDTRVTGEVWNMPFVMSN